MKGAPKWQKADGRRGGMGGVIHRDIGQGMTATHGTNGSSIHHPFDQQPNQWLREASNAHSVSMGHDQF